VHTLHVSRTENYTSPRQGSDLVLGYQRLTPERGEGAGSPFHLWREHRSRVGCCVWRPFCPASGAVLSAPAAKYERHAKFDVAVDEGKGRSNPSRGTKKKHDKKNTAPVFPPPESRWTEKDSEQS